MKITAINEYDLNENRGKRKGAVSVPVQDWYDNKTEKFLIIECDEEKEARSAYNTIYAMSKRRGKMNIGRHLFKNKVVIERLE